jgi:hypothetical protein
MTNTKTKKNSVARCNKFGDMPDGRHVTEIENDDLNIAELCVKHAAIIEHENDLTQDAAVAVRRELIRRAPSSESHCQSCGAPARRNCNNEGYSECCNELIVSHCDANHCFHIV